LFFVLFPRIQGPLWGMPDDMPGARTGLSESMQPGGIAELSNSDEIAFRVRFEGPLPPVKALYWRGPVFGNFDGTTWKPLLRPIAPLPLPSVQVDPGPTLGYQITLEPHQRSWLFALDAPVSVDQLATGAPLLRPDLQLIARERIHERTRYRLESRLDYRFGLNVTPITLQNWLDLPPGFNPRTLELAARWRNEESDNARLVERVLALFGQQPFRYDAPAAAGPAQRRRIPVRPTGRFLRTLQQRVRGADARIRHSGAGGHRLRRRSATGRRLLAVRQADAHACRGVLTGRPVRVVRLRDRPI
jgi:hypothetical protein